MNAAPLKKVPFATLLLAGAAVVVFCLGTEPHIEYERTALAAGQWWRAVTSHLAHWSGDHLLWDVATFAALGSLAERRDRARFLRCIAAAAVAITAGVWLLRPDVASYRGLSGIDSALFVMLAADIARDAIVARRWLPAAAACAAGIAFIAKTAWELASGAALFVDAGAAGFEPLALAHALGAAAALALSLPRATPKVRSPRPVPWLPCAPR